MEVKKSKIPSYGKNVAATTASKRESEALDILKSSNKLRDYGPMTCLYLVLSYLMWYFYWNFNLDSYNSICYITKSHTIDKLDPVLCPYKNITFDLDSFELVSHLTTGVFATLLILHLLQLLECDIRHSYRLPAVYCTSVINLIAFFSHLSMARGWSPMVISKFGRISHVVRWGEWLSVAPALMIMMHSINIRSKRDLRLLWESTIFQSLSVALGGYSSFTQNIYSAIVLLGLSCVFYCHIYYVVYRAYESYKILVSTNNLRKMKLFIEPKINKETNNIRRNIKSKSDEILSSHNSPRHSGTATPTKISPFHTSNISSNDDISTRQLLEEFEMVGAIISVKLAVYCTITWTLKVLIYMLGVFGYLSHTSESILQTIFDCFSKGLYARVLCSSHVAALSPEGILGRMLYMEEQANASIRQFLRFVFHEVSTPLNTLTMGLNNLSDENLTDEGVEMLNMAKEGCLHINDTLKDLLTFQEVEDGGLILNTQPVALKSLIRDVCNQYISIAKEKGIVLLLALDPKIPDYIMGEKLRFRQVLTILIQNGIDNSKQQCAVLTELKNNINFDVSTAHIRIAIRDDGNGYTNEEIDNLFNPYSHLSSGNIPSGRGLGMSLCVAKQIIELHGGTLTLETDSNGSTFYCDVVFIVPLNLNEISNQLENESVNNNLDSEGTIISTKSSRRSSNKSPKILLHSKKDLSYEFINKSRNQQSDLIQNESSNQLSNDRVDYIAKIALRALVVDDVQSNRKLLQRTLERIGFNVELVNDGDELLDKVINETGIYNKYDVIFLDNMMPRLPGVDAIKILRANNYNGLVIGVTGNVLEEDVLEFKQAGCNDVLPKPVNVNHLKQVLSKLGLDT